MLHRALPFCVFVSAMLCAALAFPNMEDLPSEGVSLTVATLNLNRFFDTVDDPARRDKVMSRRFFQEKVKKLSWFIRHQLDCPNIVAVQEVENIRALTYLAREVCPDKSAYQAYLKEGNDISGIDVGFLVSSELRVQHIQQLGNDIKISGSRSRLFDRPPLLLRLSSNVCETRSFNFVAVHNRSFWGLRHPDKHDRVHKKRLQQAQWIGQWLRTWTQSYPRDQLILLGDFNAMPSGEVLEQVNKRIEGEKHSLLMNLAARIPEEERYSYLFRGKKQAIDHIFVTPNLVSSLREVYYTRFNTERDLYASIGGRASDHEGMVAHFEFSGCK